LKQKQLTVCFLIIICTVVLLGCGNNEIQSQASSTTKTIEDMAGRSLIVPDKIDKVFCTSATGTIVIYTLCPEKLVGWNYDLSAVEKKYILPDYQELPNLGGWFAKSTGNIEEILKIAPDIIISLGVINDAERSNADQIEQQLDIPVLLVDGELTEIDRTYEYLGELLGMESEAQQLADYCRQTVDEVAAQVKIPLPWTPVPITGQTFAVLLTGVLWGAQGGTLAVTAYLLLGWMGVPFFAGTTGLAGPTAGYLIGFIPAAYFTGILYNRFAWTKRLTGLLLIMTLANFIFIHGTGLIWLGCITGISDITKLLTLGTLPFLSGDLIKITAAAAIARSFTTRK
jgi:biotin transporter BioY